MQSLNIYKTQEKIYNITSGILLYTFSIPENIYTKVLQWWQKVCVMSGSDVDNELVFVYGEDYKVKEKILSKIKQFTKEYNIQCY